jgi:hypothetical protein
METYNITKTSPEKHEVVIIINAHSSFTRKDTFRGKVGGVDSKLSLESKQEITVLTLVSIFNACVLQHEMENECE